MIILLAANCAAKFGELGKMFVWHQDLKQINHRIYKTKYDNCVGKNKRKDIYIHQKASLNQRKFPSHTVYSITQTLGLKITEL